jgi:uncharacterized protein YvpB
MIFMISTFFIIAVLFLMFILLVWMLKKAAVFFKAAFLLVMIIFIAYFALSNSSTGQMPSALSSLNAWVHSPLVKASSFLDDHFNMPIISIKEQVHLDVPVISQIPELPRGCEVTSLAMLLNDSGVKVDKMELADKVKKDPTPQTITNGQIHFGNPNDGFVGNMYNYREPGFGVYHKPVADLADKYLPGKVNDLTASDFQELKYYLSDGRPIWVITNTSYKKLDDRLFQTWDTPSGKVRITFKEHSVLLTGYDLQFVYFNDPLTGEKNKKAPIKDFEESWVQMGSQAITYIP